MFRSTINVKSLALALLAAVLWAGPGRGQELRPEADQPLDTELKKIEFDKTNLAKGRAKLEFLKSDADAAKAKYEQKKQAVAEQKVQIDRERPIYERDNDALKKELDGLKKTKKDLDARGNQLDTDRAGLDRRNHYAVDEFNKRIRDWNEDNDAYGNASDDYKRRRDELVVRYKVLIDIIHNHDTGVGEVKRFYDDWQVKVKAYGIQKNKVADDEVALKSREDAYKRQAGAVKGTGGTTIIFVDGAPKQGTPKPGPTDSSKPPPGTEPGTHKKP